MRPVKSYLRSALSFVTGQKVVVELRTVEHACKRFGGGGEGLGKAVVGGRSCRGGGRLWKLLARPVHWSLLREALVRQEVGVDRALPGRRLGCGQSLRSENNLTHVCCSYSKNINKVVKDTFRWFGQCDWWQRRRHLRNWFIFGLHWTWLLYRLHPVKKP